MSTAHIEAVTPSSRPHMSPAMAKALRPSEWIAAARRSVGGSFGIYRNTPVRIVEGSDVAVTGESYYFTTPSGKTRVQYPGAYKWRTVYHPSTLCIEIGRDWRPVTTRRDREIGCVD